MTSLTDQKNNFNKFIELFADPFTADFDIVGKQLIKIGEDALSTEAREKTEQLFQELVLHSELYKLSQHPNNENAFKALALVLGLPLLGLVTEEGQQLFSEFLKSGASKEV